MSDESDFNNIDDEVFNLEELDSSSIKINPDFYIHDTLIKASNALSNPDVKDRFLQYRQFIEHLEILTRAAGKLPPDYEEQINIFKISKEYSEAEAGTIKNSILINKKLELILGDVFRRKTITSPLKFSHYREKLNNRINELEEQLTQRDLDEKNDSEAEGENV
jgi:hypothetical protein